MNKSMLTAITIALVTLLMVVIGSICIHVNRVEDIQVVQSPGGKITVRRAAGFYVAPFSRITTYPKASLEYCSNNPKESKAHDALEIQYKNKSTGTINCQIGYRIDTSDDETFLKLHEWAHGDDEIIWQKVVTKLQDCCQSAASQISASDSVDKYVDFVAEIRTRFLGNKELRAMGIDVVTFDCSGRPKPDKTTEEMLQAQLKADLMKKTAEAEKAKLVMEKERAVAEYEKQMAENEGKAKAQMAKEVTDAEREKRLAEIAAQKKVEVEKLEKEQLLVQAAKEKEVAEVAAQKMLAVAEVEKQTEARNLEIVELQAKQKIAQAEAKKKEIELSGAITETDRVRLEIEKETKIGVAQAYAEGLGKMKLPVVMNSGAAGGNASGPEAALRTFFDLKNAATALEVMDSAKK